MAFDEFYLVLLEHGPNREQPKNDEEREALNAVQMAHLTLLKDLYDRGVSVGAGPFVDGKGGIMLLRAGDRTEDDVMDLLKDDAHIKLGRLVPVIRKFVVPKGVL